MCTGELKMNEEKLIGLFGALCDYLIGEGKCDTSCPFADTYDNNYGECEAWHTISEIRKGAEYDTKSCDN